jgi:hypothetical protein
MGSRAAAPSAREADASAQLSVGALWRWFLERYPPVAWVLFASFYLAAAWETRAALGRAPGAGSRDAAGIAASCGFFLLLRVLDEHKDFDRDCRNHPDRVLQRGDVTLEQLKLVGGAAAAITLGASLAADGGVGGATTAWLLMIGWTALMTREFFAREWLSRRLLAYGVSHMLVMPLAALWMAHLAVSRVRLGVPVVLLATLFFLGGMAFELARKTLAPDEERVGVDSYSKTVGARLAGTLAAAILAFAASVGVAAVLAVGGGAVAVALIAIIAGAAVAAAVAFSVRPRQTLAHAVRSAFPIAVLLVNAVVAVSAVAS